MKWAPFAFLILFCVSAVGQDNVELNKPAGDAPAEADTPPESPPQASPDAMSIREAFAAKIGEQFSGRQARLFENRSRYRERVIDEAIDKAITDGILDPVEAFNAPGTVVAEIMGEATAAADEGRPPRDWVAFFESLKPFIEWFMQLLAGFGVFG